MDKSSPAKEGIPHTKSEQRCRERVQQRTPETELRTAIVIVVEQECRAARLLQQHFRESFNTIHTLEMLKHLWVQDKRRAGSAYKTIKFTNKNHKHRPK